MPPSLHSTPHFLALADRKELLDDFYNAEQDTATQGNTTEDSSLQQTQLAHDARTRYPILLLVKNIALPYAECHKCCTYPTSLAPWHRSYDILPPKLWYLHKQRTASPLYHNPHPTGLLWTSLNLMY